MPNLNSAANFNNLEEAQQCIDRGDNVNQADGGYPPLLVAANHGALEVAELLVAHGADINFWQHDDITPTPMHMAIGHNRARIARLLVNSGADLTLTNSDNKTPIEYAQDRHPLLAAALETNTEDAWQAAIAEEIQQSNQRNLNRFAMAQQGHQGRGRMGFFNAGGHELNREIEHAIYTGEITSEEEVLQRMNMVRQQIQQHHQAPPQVNQTFPIPQRPEITNVSRLAAAEYSGEIQPEFICPITNEIMDDPVSIPGSHQSFERSALHQWLNIRATNPLNPGQAITLEDIQTATTIHDQINELVSSVSSPPPNRGCNIS